jgi:hypothetical protein
LKLVGLAATGQNCKYRTYTKHSHYAPHHLELSYTLGMLLNLRNINSAIQAIQANSG